MTEISFDIALQRGLGRAVQMLRESGDGAAHREMIEQACRNNLAYDPQLENDRDEYLVNILEASGDLAWHLPRLREALWQPQWYFAQLAMICARLTRLGHADLRAELYSAWKHHFHSTPEDSRMDGAEALLWLDGAAGWRFMQSEVLTSPWSEDESWRTESLYDDLVEQVGSRAARHAGDSDPLLRAVIAGILREQQENQRDRRQIKRNQLRAPDISMSAMQIRAALETRRYSPYALAQRASNEVFCAVAAAAPTELEALKRWIRLFRRRPYPLSPTLLLGLTEHAELQLAWSAFLSLAIVEHPMVRAYAERLAGSDSPFRLRIGALLATNPGPNDTALLKQVWQSVENDNEIDQFSIGMRSFEEARPDDVPLPLMITLYEKSPSPRRRHDCVEWLLARDAAPDWLLEEIAWDCDEETRAYSAAP